SLDSSGNLKLPMGKISQGRKKLSLSYRLGQNIDRSYADFSLSLPAIDIPTGKLHWRVYAPHNFRLFGYMVNISQAGGYKFFLYRYISQLEKLSLKLARYLINRPEIIFILFCTLLIIWGIRHTYKTDWRPWRIIGALAVVFFIIFFLAMLSTPNFRRARKQARSKSCFANIRVIMGAVEMYNMDTPNKMRQLDMDSLINQNYLKQRPQCPARGDYFTQGDLSSNGTVRCNVHGGPTRDPIAGGAEYDAEDEDMVGSAAPPEVSRRKRLAIKSDKMMAQKPGRPYPREEGKAAFKEQRLPPSKKMKMEERGKRKRISGEKRPFPQRKRAFGRGGMDTGVLPIRFQIPSHGVEINLEKEIVQSNEVFKFQGYYFGGKHALRFLRLIAIIVGILSAVSLWYIILSPGFLAVIVLIFSMIFLTLLDICLPASVPVAIAVFCLCFALFFCRHLFRYFFGSTLLSTQEAGS
ncbi:competence type IV pilus major pilin ComGC, partial [Candidatus Riflebacteria bacterium]